MIVRRGRVWWAKLREPGGSEPGFECPVVVVQSDDFNETPIQTIIVAVTTTNMRWAGAPGNVTLPAADVGLREDSVVNVSQLLTLDRRFLMEPVGSLSAGLQRAVDSGLRFVLGVESD